MPQSTAEAFLRPRPGRALLAALGGEKAAPNGMPLPGAVRTILPRRGGPCPWGGVTPVVLGQSAAPRVGQPFRLVWALDYVGPPRRNVDADGVETPPAVGVLAALAPLHEPIEGAPGCWLLVRPETILVPTKDGIIRYDEKAGLVTLDWTPPPGLAGVSIYLQLLVAVPGSNVMGHVVSAGVELVIGSPP